MALWRISNADAEATKRGIKVINDMVLNHTSDQHPWFKESKSSRKEQKADWYVWQNADAKGHPPNNWQSIFGHSAWQWTRSESNITITLFTKNNRFEFPEPGGERRDVRHHAFLAG